MRKAIILILLGAVILSCTAFYNKFPLLTPDSVAYMAAGFSKIVPEGRTAIYGLFIAQASGGFSLWLVVFCQALLVSLMIFYCCKYFSNSLQYRILYLVFIFFITFFTSASVAISTIGVGVFSIISLMAISLILWANLNTRDRYIIYIIAIISLAAAIAHIIAVFLIVLLYGAVILVRSFTGTPAAKMYRQRLAAGGLVLLLSCITVLGLHYAMRKSIDTPKVAPGFTHRMQFRIENFYPTRYEAGMHESVKKWFSWESREGAVARQYIRGLEFSQLSYIQLTGLLLFVAIMTYLLISKSIRFRWQPFIAGAFGITVFIITGSLFSPETHSPAWQMMWLLFMTGHSTMRSPHHSIV